MEWKRVWNWNIGYMPSRFTHYDLGVDITREESAPRRRLRSLLIERESARRIVEEIIKDCARRIRGISRLDNVIVESIDTDSWGNIPIYCVRGHIEVQVRRGLLSRRPGEKSFIVTMKAVTGEVLAIDWEPGRTE